MYKTIIRLCVLIAASVVPSAHQAECGQTALARDTAALIEGLGTYTRNISAKSRPAQQFFDQGLRLYYSYYFPESVASFQEALRHDPENPMILWGLALAIGPGPNSRYYGFPDDPYGESRKAITAARKLAAKATPVERAMIESLYVRFDTDTYPDRATRDVKYIEATRSVLDRFPDDLEAGLMYADAIMTHSQWKYWRRDGTPLLYTREAAAALEHVMALKADHPGAVHLYIHLFESSAEPDRALPQADRLESITPKAGHMVHMPSHIYIRVGQYDKAIASNERSIAADRFFLTGWGSIPFPTIGTYGLSARTHPAHAWDFIRFAAMLQGNYARTVEAARASAAGQTHSMGVGRRRIATTWLVHKIFGKWDAVLAEPAPHDKSAYLDGLWRYARGSAFSRRGEIEKASGELEQLRANAADPSLKGSLNSINPAPRILELATRALEGEIAMAGGQHDAAVRSFEEAVRIQDSLDYVEPPDWGQSMRLYLGAALLKAGRPGDAEAVYLADLREFRENGWALFGLWQSLRDQRKSVEAQKARERFERAWKGSDVSLNASIF